MKRVALAFSAVVLIAGWLTVREFSWRHENSILEASALSPSGHVVAEAYLMNEGGGQEYGRGPAPYGIGVYLRRRAMPLKSFGATLVFAAYCGPEVRLDWVGSAELRIECAAQEPPKLLLASHEGVKITYVLPSAKSS